MIRAFRFLGAFEMCEITGGLFVVQNAHQKRAYNHPLSGFIFCALIKPTIHRDLDF